MQLSTKCRSSTRFSEISRCSHDILTRSITSLTEGEVTSYGDLPFSSLNVTTDAEGSYVACTGDSGGWLQTFTANSRWMSPGYSRELYLGSMVSAICRSPTHRLAVSFGPSCKIAVENTVEDDELWTIMNMPAGCYDIRTAHLSGNSLALGAARKGILFPDIDVDWHYQVLPTGSDVFSIIQHHNLIYTGTRGGSIKAFDKRVNAVHKGEELFGSRYSRAAKSITHISVLYEWQLLVSTIAGEASAGHMLLHAGS
ncbi:hypothetical protein NM688_g9189 [Phlebia brevispora]|uniref:Uncharacterized protein n=1 Tax=Phlebia brevispora TaxID=194682 RepID=A0ACC1RKF1_9APHY|nr:hypothetical protein NM688_g9189 [Phlebia brevispora]